jgi:four helix bundle protein
MASYKRFEDLPVWQKARTFAKEADTLIRNSAIKTNFKLKDQMSGSSGSVMDNISEGFERGGNKEFIAFLSYSKGSAGEFRSQLYRCLDCGYITQDEFDKLKMDAERISGELEGFINYLSNSGQKGHKFTNR